MGSNVGAKTTLDGVRLRAHRQDEIRKRIQVSQLLNRLEKQALGDVDFLTPTQLKAIEILLKKSLPDLSSVEHTGDPDNPIEHKAVVEIIDVKKNTAPKTA